MLSFFRHPTGRIWSVAIRSLRIGAATCLVASFCITNAYG